MPRHLLALEDFTWEFVVTDGARMSVGDGVTVSGSLTTEVPSLHGALVTLTLRNGLDVHELTDLEMARA